MKTLAHSFVWFDNILAAGVVVCAVLAVSLLICRAGYHNKTGGSIDACQ